MENNKANIRVTNELNDDQLNQVTGGTDSVTFLGTTWTVGEKVRIGMYTGGCRYCGSGNPYPLCTIVRLTEGCMASAKLIMDCCGEPEFLNLDRLMKI